MHEPNQSDPEVIRVENLTFKYPNGFLALEDINLSIKQGEFVAFIGQNGSGKTTLAKHFVGLCKAPKNTVFVNGKDTYRVPIVDLARNIGYVFQNADSQIFCSSVLEEVSYGPKNLGLKEDEISDRVTQSLIELGIEHLKKEHPLALSWGDRQKVAIASIIAIGPEILILDEPTTGQDLRGGHEILKTCQRLNENGKTIIVITHNMELVAEYAKKVYLLHNGHILNKGATNDIFLQLELLRMSFISPPQITRLAMLISKEIPAFPPGILTNKHMVEELLKRTSITPHIT